MGIDLSIATSDDVYVSEYMSRTLLMMYMSVNTVHVASTSCLFRGGQSPGAASLMWTKRPLDPGQWEPEPVMQFHGCTVIDGSLRVPEPQ